MLLCADDVFCNLNYKAACPGKFLEEILNVFPLIVDNCFESAQFVQFASTVIRSMFRYIVVDSVMPNY